MHEGACETGSQIPRAYFAEQIGLVIKDQVTLQNKIHRYISIVVYFSAHYLKANEYTNVAKLLVTEWSINTLNQYYYDNSSYIDHLNNYGHISPSYAPLTWRLETFTGWNWKCHVIIVIKTDLSGFVVPMYSGLCYALGTNPSRTGLNPLNIHFFKTNNYWWERSWNIRD